jgi:hypothetical protein
LRTRQIPDDLKTSIPQVISEFLAIAKKGDTSEYNAYVEKLMQALQPYLYGSGSKSLSKDVSDFILKIKTIEDSFQWYDAVLLTYPHVDIGRYPTLIEKSDSNALYLSHMDDLLRLLEYVRNVCKNINSAISPR